MNTQLKSSMHAGSEEMNMIKLFARAVKKSKWSSKVYSRNFMFSTIKMRMPPNYFENDLKADSREQDPLGGHFFLLHFFFLRNLY
mmetsp:Transcript_113773/g.326935  ORF Transcript_113773/g.326935 Transcript_113773/m.326935 type:complete len:85 (+) Transcript_113773:173-427(+)